MLANNSRINWQPEHIRDGRFGNFLETNVDWALSRERYWGTPLPIWICEETGYMEAVAGYDELLAKAGRQRHGSLGRSQAGEPRVARRLEGPQTVHRRDHLRLAQRAGQADAARAGGDRLLVRLRRDAVCPMGLSAQERLHRAAGRAVSRRLQSARRSIRPGGWFYSLLAISTLLFSETPSPQPSPKGRGGQVEYPHPYRNCVVLGLMLGEDGGKMSKQKRNYREPQEIFDRYGRRRSAVVFLLESGPVDVDPLQRTGDQGEYPRIPPAAVERLQFFRHLR